MFACTTRMLFKIQLNSLAEIGKKPYNYRNENAFTTGAYLIHGKSIKIFIYSGKCINKHWEWDGK